MPVNTRLNAGSKRPQIRPPILSIGAFPRMGAGFAFIVGTRPECPYGGSYHLGRFVMTENTCDIQPSRSSLWS
jgi:hypothetical protein